MNRNVYTVSHLDPELQEWFKEEAKRRTHETGIRVWAWQLFNIAAREFMERQNHQSIAEEVSHAD